MNSDEDIYQMVEEIGKIIENYSNRIDQANLTACLIGIIHLIGEESGYSRKEWNHIMKELIKKNYRIKCS